ELAERSLQRRKRLLYFPQTHIWHSSIKDYRGGKWEGVAGKKLECLLLPTFKDRKILRLQAAYQSTAVIGDRDRKQDEVRGYRDRIEIGSSFRVLWNAARGHGSDWRHRWRGWRVIRRRSPVRSSSRKLFRSRCNARARIIRRWSRRRVFLIGSAPRTRRSRRRDWPRGRWSVWNLLGLLLRHRGSGQSQYQPQHHEPAIFPAHP